MTHRTSVNQIEFTDKDIVNPDDYIPAENYNPHNVRLWLVHDAGFVVGAAFADCLQDAFDILADGGRLDAFQIEESDYDDYDFNTDSPTCAFLGNAGEPFDIDPLAVVEIPAPPMSICALLNAACGK